MGFGQGLSGLNAASQSLDVIGNNVANSGTVGFKAGTANFADVYANSRVGLGVQVSSISQRFTVGSVTGTGNQFDMAIDGAKGLFRVQDTSGNILYTRNGQFFADKDNFIVNAQGQRLTGYVGAGTDLAPIKVPVGNISPAATGTVGTSANLRANAPVISPVAVSEVPGQVVLTAAGGGAVTGTYQYRVTGSDIQWLDTATPPNPGPIPPDGSYTTTGANTVTIAGGQITSGAFDSPPSGADVAYVAPVIAEPFDPANPNSYTDSLPITVYDSLGNAHQLTQYFVKRDGTATESKWDVNYRLDGAAMSPADGATQMTFDGAGRLTSASTVALSAANPGGSGSPANALGITLNYAGTTQFGGDFSHNFIQNGFPTGEYASMSVAADGSIVANYTNGETQRVGTLALADFNNLQGLQPAGGNAWIETSASGQPILGVPGSNGLAAIKGQSVEESNVDMSQELVDMIIAQRTYQANAQTIKTQDQVLQTLISLR